MRHSWQRSSADPEPLIFTTTKDDRVGPVHARKFAARLEEFHKPFFYDEITEGGTAGLRGGRPLQFVGKNKQELSHSPQQSLAGS